MSKSLRNIYAYTFIYSFLLLNPIWVIYLLRLGYSFYYVTLLDVIFYLTIVFASLPGGRFADVVGRRVALVVSSLITGAGIIFFGLFTSFAGIALSYILWGVGVAINSSALESLTYDYSKSHDKKFLEIFGMVNFLASISVAIASVVGGPLGEYKGLKLVIIASGIIVAASSINAFNIKERKRPIIKERKSLNLSKYILDRRIFSILILRVALLLNFNMLILFKQPYYLDMGIGMAAIGVIFFFDVTLRGISSLYSMKFSFITRDRFSSMLYFTSLTFFTIFIPSLMENIFSIFLLILNSIIFGFYTNILSEEVNSLIPASTRATILSFVFIVSAILTAAAEPGLGYLATIKGVKFTLLVFSFMFLALSVSAIFLYIQRKDTAPFSLKSG